MEEIEKLQNCMQEHFNEMFKTTTLYTMNLKKDELWNIYLDSFPEGKNKMFRERREHDCSACRSFVNQFGDVVAIKDNKIISVWDFDIDSDVYSDSVKALRKHIKSKNIGDVFLSPIQKIGVKENKEMSDTGKVLTWKHMYVELPKKFVLNNGSISTTISNIRTNKQVFQRGLEELSEESIETILELIQQNSLYKGEEWKHILTTYIKNQKKYHKLNDEQKDIFLWVQASLNNQAILRLRNHSMGNLLQDVSNGTDLEVAVKKYEQMVAPTNYKRPNAIYTKRMLEDAKKKIEELGYIDSLQRRFAILEDISVNNVLYANRDDVKRMQSNDVFDELEKDVTTKPKDFNKVESIKIDDFITNVLPTATNVEVYLENKHKRNMVSLIAPYKKDSKTMFKWDNNFSWAYSGNITDSDIKTNVKSAGGKVDGVLRFSIQWNDLDIYNRNDLDAHCYLPNKEHIYFSSKQHESSTGMLDVDIINPTKNKPAVENITWTDINKMPKGTYNFFVRNYSNMGGNDGFRAEIEFNGEVHKFDYRKPIRQGADVPVAEVTFDGTNFTIQPLLESESSTIDVWNLKSNSFVPVSTIMFSPNYWNEQKGIGNKHYFFMLKDCKSNETPNGFFNEFLDNALTPHRKVFEALGSKMKVDYIDNQLSGVGFSSTQRNEFIVKIEGKIKRILKITI